MPASFWGDGPARRVFVFLPLLWGPLGGPEKRLFFFFLLVLLFFFVLVFFFLLVFFLAFLGFEKTAVCGRGKLEPLGARRVRGVWGGLYIGAPKGSLLDGGVHRREEKFSEGGGWRGATGEMGPPAAHP